MKLVGKPIIEEFLLRHADARGPLAAWCKEVENSRWGLPQDIKDRYQSASILSDNRVIFNIKGNSYRLVVVVGYQNGIVRVEWLGTHAEYDRMRF